MQRCADVNRQAAQRVARNDAQIAADANWWAIQRAPRNDAQIALENAARANT
jgi:hypothetical protein